MYQPLKPAPFSRPTFDSQPEYPSTQTATSGNPNKEGATNRTDEKAARTSENVQNPVSRDPGGTETYGTEKKLIQRLGQGIFAIEYQMGEALLYQFDGTNNALDAGSTTVPGVGKTIYATGDNLSSFIASVNDANRKAWPRPDPAKSNQGMRPTFRGK